MKKHARSFDRACMGVRVLWAPRGAEHVGRAGYAHRRDRIFCSAKPSTCELGTLVRATTGQEPKSSGDEQPGGGLGDRR